MQFKVDNKQGYPWCKSDAGRSASRRSKKTNDCTVRAVATAYCISYDEAYELLRKASRVSGKRFKLSIFLNGQSWAKWSAFQARKGMPRMNIVNFIATHPRGRFICKTAKHVFAVIDGVVIDDLPTPIDRCIYGCWEIYQGEQE